MDNLDSMSAIRRSTGSSCTLRAADRPRGRQCSLSRGWVCGFGERLLNSSTDAAVKGAACTGRNAPGLTWVQARGQAPGQAPGQALGQAPGQARVQARVQEQWLVQVQLPGQVPGQGEAQAPARAQDRQARAPMQVHQHAGRPRRQPLRWARAPALPVLFVPPRLPSTFEVPPSRRPRQWLAGLRLSWQCAPGTAPRLGVRGTPRMGHRA